MTNELCVVDTVNLYIYNFADNQEQAEETLIRAIKANQNDIETWGKHCKNYPNVEQFQTYLKQAKNKKYEIMTYSDYTQVQRNYYLNKPLTEITKEEYNDMLNVLPPKKWCTIGSVEMFCMSEMLTGCYTSQYMYDMATDKYYHKTVDITDKTTWGYNFIPRIVM